MNGENVQAQKVPQTGCEITIVGSEDREIVRRSFVCNKNSPQMDVCRVAREGVRNTVKDQKKACHELYFIWKVARLVKNVFGKVGMHIMS